MPSTRDRMVESATALFRDQGFDGTGFRQLVQAAGTTPGVIYHHFPQGKAELGIAVANAVGDRVAARVERICNDLSPREAVGGLMQIVEEHMVRGDLRPGCPIAAICLAAEDPQGELRAATDAFFTRTRSAIHACLLRAGVPHLEALDFAALSVAACEGAVILCRATKGVEPLQSTRRALLRHLDDLIPSRAPTEGPTDGA